MRSINNCKIKIYVIILLLLISRDAKGETITLSSPGMTMEPSLYKLTFDSSIISEEQMKELVVFSPNDSFGSDDFSAPSLELCVKDKPEYFDCGTRDLNAVNFYKNAQVNLNKGRKTLDLLKSIKYPKELGAIVNYFEKSLSFSLWLNEKRFDFYQSWDIDILKGKYEDLDPSVLCPEALNRIESTDDNYKKYKMTLYEWYNCLNRIFRKHLGEYPLEAWEQFLATYGIKEELVSDDGD